MKVQTRLSLFCSIVFGVIFAIVSLLIYGLYRNNATNTIYKNLEKNAHISALFYFEADELSQKDFEKIKIQFTELVADSYFQIYNAHNRIEYGIQSSDISTATLEKIKSQKKLSFDTPLYFCYGTYYEDNQGNFIVIAKERKTMFESQMRLLLAILISSFVIGLIAIILLSKWVSRIAYSPFTHVISQIKNISTHNLDVQIALPNTKDELQDLIATFNDLLAKISETVVIQKNFANYVSHEFKTPLASILGNLEVFSLKDRKPEEYNQLSEKLVEQIHQLEEILNTLIVISNLRNDVETIDQIRIDELIWKIIHQIKDRYPWSKILVNIDILPEEEHLLAVNKNSTQLLMALFNLIENAVKYSQEKNVEIRLFKKDEKLCVSIADKGIGIPQNELKNINKPFYRADNANKIQGSGIGLSIALRILEKNQIEYQIESKINIGTTIFLWF